MHLTLAERGVWVATPAVAQRFDISVHHLQKIAQTLVRAGVVEARQGRSGGVRLARDAREIRLGRLVADLEGVGTVVDCRRDPWPTPRPLPPQMGLRRGGAGVLPRTRPPHPRRRGGRADGSRTSLPLSWRAGKRGGDAGHPRSDRSDSWQLSGGWGREGRLLRASGTRW
ncbi:RrF2 family transcriptional regulator [Methylorubrum extorquens]|uniref:RrF2 family transcriptional regulator n=1 Tax=Methylorubrum extorquens TaxID=408 RepID=UPI000158FF86|nr:Rrf2 family transcriptional regulator [Methylorubrum extorquens]